MKASEYRQLIGKKFNYKYDKDHSKIIIIKDFIDTPGNEKYVLDNGSRVNARDFLTKAESIKDDGEAAIVTDEKGNIVNNKIDNTPIKSSHKNEPPNKLVNQKISTGNTVMSILFSKFKLHPTEINIDINLELPSIAIIKLMLEEMNDEEDEMIDYLISKVNVEKLKIKLKDKIKSLIKDN